MSSRVDASVEAHLDEFFATPGPSGYACLFTPQELRARVRVVCATHGLIRGVGQSREAEIARTKLQWWQEELLRLSEDTPRHPLCVLLAAESADPSGVAAALREAVFASAEDLAALPLDNNEAIELHCVRADGSLLRATAAACGPLAAKLDPPLATLAHGIGLVRLLKDAHTTDEAAELTRETAARLLADGLAGLAGNADPRVVFPYVLGSLWQQRLAHMPNVPHVVRQLFAAWRAARASRDLPDFRNQQL